MLNLENTDIFSIARFGDLEIFRDKFVINQINEKFNNNSGLLHHAIAGKNFDIASFLIEKGIDVNMVDDEGSTALHYICVYQNLKVAKELLQKGIDVNAKDKFGNNALWTAISSCDWDEYEIVELLMEYHSDILNQNNAGSSPLDRAKLIGNEKLINILLGKIK